MLAYRLTAAELPGDEKIGLFSDLLWLIIGFVMQTGGG